MVDHSNPKCFLLRLTIFFLTIGFQVCAIVAGGLRFPVMYDDNTNRNAVQRARSDRLQFPLASIGSGFGEYFAIMKIGTPPKSIALAIDTGSQLLWLQCEPCIRCGTQAQGYSIYNPAGSSTYVAFACNDGECRGDSSVATACSSTRAARIGTDSGPRVRNNPDMTSHSAIHHDDAVAAVAEAASGERCIYAVSYGDSSNSTGYLSAETFSMPTARVHTSVLADNIVFGCGLVNTGLISTLQASGLLGLDRGPFSLITQLDIKTFSYCFPNRWPDHSRDDDVGGRDDSRAAGFLSLGSTPTDLADGNLQYTPLLRNVKSDFLSQFYYLNLTGISVNDRLLTIPASAFGACAAHNEAPESSSTPVDCDSPESSSSTTIIDSGTTITSFVHAAYVPLARAFDEAMDPSLTRINLGDEALKLCYQVPVWNRRAPSPPRVTLHLAGPVDLRLESLHVIALVGSDTSYSYYCMAFMDSGSGPSATNYIGNYQQQDFLVEYDLVNNRIGFAPSTCSNAMGPLLWRWQFIITQMLVLSFLYIHFTNNIAQL